MLTLRIFHDADGPALAEGAAAAPERLYLGHVQGGYVEIQG